MSDAPMTTLTLDSLRDILQQAGYRVEAVTDPTANIPYLRSATAGVGFDIRPGNRVVGDAKDFVDLAFVAVLQVQGELPLELVNRWNTTRRFARLQLSHPFLLLCLDVSVAGGVSSNHLRAQIEIWDRLVQELIAYLRDELGKIGATKDAAAAVAQVPAQHQPKRSRATEPDTAAVQ